ncbi:MULTISPECIES: MarR family winged helix-turn-helix transcriptional regulator [Actinomyces]|uniref:MarR family winged helix-turn-helix transcriptional regulator n=1 Tax=Actinomyces TaxID=1654 RepID=UPI000980EDDE|nr:MULTISPECIES: MarR family transcriptional regulator [Actinomyces]
MPHDPLELDRQLCFSLYRASRTVTRAYRPLLKDIGLTYPQYLVMLALWQSGGPMSLNDIGSRLSLDSGTLTPLLRRLEETGLITRARDRADERRRLITLTSAGRDLRKRAATIPDRMIALYSQPAEDLERLKSMLDDMAARLA